MKIRRTFLAGIAVLSLAAVAVAQVIGVPLITEGVPA